MPSPKSSRRNPRAEAFAQEVRQAVMPWDRFTAKAFEDFLKEFKAKFMAACHEREPVAKIQTPQGRAAVVGLLAAKVEQMAQQRRVAIAMQEMKIAELALLFAQGRLLLAVSKHEDVDPPGEFDVDVFRLAIFRKDVDDDAKEADDAGGAQHPPALVEFAKSLVEADEGQLRKVHHGELPESVREAIGPEQHYQLFLKDLADYLLERGDLARTQLRAIEASRDLARNAASDRSLPQPVRFFGLIALGVAA